MPLWGLDASSDANKPKYLNTKQAEETFADARGWVHRNAKGFEEVLVAIGDLATTLVGANITSLAFNSTSQTAAAGKVSVFYDEKVKFLLGLLH